MSATETDLAAADWLQKKTFWTWSEEDQKALDAWLDESEAHRVAFWRQSAMWNRTERLAALRPSPKPERARLPERKSLWPLLMRSAAVIGAAAILGVFATNYAFNPKTDALFHHHRRQRNHHARRRHTDPAQHRHRPSYPASTNITAKCSSTGAKRSSR